MIATDTEIDESSSPPPKRTLARIIFVLFVLGVIAGVSTLSLWIYYDHTLQKAMMAENQPVNFVIFPGQSTKGIANRLKEEGLISDPLVFRLALKIQHKDTTVEAGEYELDRNLTMQEIIDALQSGRQKERWITIKEGWRIEDIAAYLAGRSLVSEDEFVDLAYHGNFDYAFLSSAAPYDKPEGTSLEGYLFPDTYLIPAGATARTIISIMLNNFQTKFDEEIQSRLRQSSLFEVVSLASIVEKEGRDLEEKKIISGIYHNRLDNSIPLGACPTILYALGDWKAVLTDDNLKIDSPYNTRLYKGLPPGPIANPGLDSLIASLEPASTDYLYFLTDKDGIMRYAYTNAEHEKNKAVYGVSGQ